MTAPDDIDRLIVGDVELNEMMQQQIAWVTACLADGTHENWSPKLTALVKGGPDDKGELFMYVLDIDFNEHEEKHSALRMIGRSLYRQKKVPVAVTISSEAWHAEQREGTRAPYCQPRHDPARQEVISISGITRVSRCMLMTSAPIERDRKNRIKLGEFMPVVKPVKLALLSSVFVGFYDEVRAAGVKLPGGADAPR